MKDERLSKSLQLLEKFFTETPMSEIEKMWKESSKNSLNGPSIRNVYDSLAAKECDFIFEEALFNTEFKFTLSNLTTLSSDVLIIQNGVNINAVITKAKYETVDSKPSSFVADGLDDLIAA